MDIERAKALLGALADGVNPITGEVLPEDDSCNQVEIVRALNIILRALEKQPPKANLKSPENAWRVWTKEDENDLCRMFDAGYTKEEICNHFKRSVDGIAAKLVRLGKISEREEFRRRLR